MDDEGLADAAAANPFYLGLAGALGGQAWRARCPIYLALVKPLQVTTHLEVKKG